MIDDDCQLISEEYTEEKVKIFIRPFNLKKAPLFRVGFVSNKMLLFDMDHIISDGYTMSLFVQELVNYYNNKDISKLIISYSDYVIDLYEKKKK